MTKIFDSLVFFCYFIHKYEFANEFLPLLMVLRLS